MEQFLILLGELYGYKGVIEGINRLFEGVWAVDQSTYIAIPTCICQLVMDSFILSKP